jgi:hypothetical protein
VSDAKINPNDIMEYIKTQTRESLQGTFVGSSTPKCSDIDHYIQSVETRIKENDELNSILRETLENLKSFSFKEGDVVVSKTEGNGIVMGIGVGNDGFIDRVDDDFSNKFYVIIATKKGYAKVSPKDIVPYTKASRALYEQK